MRILVTGGAGFIGSHVVQTLLQRGDDVTVLDDLRHGLRDNVPSQAAFIRLDMTCPSLGEIVGRNHFDAIVHLAAQTRVDTSMEHPKYDTHESVMGTVDILEFACTHHVGRVIFASSAAVYGNPGEDALPIHETQPLQPLSFYGYSKMTAEGYLKLYHDCYGLDYVVLRFANVYGERKEIDDEGGVIDVFAKRAAKGLPITIYGDGKQSRDYIYVGDIASGIVAALETTHVNEAYNLSTEREVTLLDVIDMLRRGCGLSLQPAFAATRSGDIYRSVLSHEKAKSLLLWEPHMTIENGLVKTYQYFRDHT